MKVIFTDTLRLGLKRFEKGDEIDVPDSFAARLIRGGKVEAVKEKAPKKAAPEKDAEEKSTSYKTRRIKAENDD